jgi:hypothetical protein
MVLAICGSESLQSFFHNLLKDSIFFNSKKTTPGTHNILFLAAELKNTIARIMDAVGFCLISHKV